MNSRHTSAGHNARHQERWRFLKLSIYVEGGIAVAALAAGNWLKLPLSTNLKPSPEAIGIGVLGTMPLLVMLWLTYRSRSRGILEIRQLLLEFLGKSLASCRWLDLCLVALLAGAAEELLFRGIIEPLIGRWSPALGFVIGNVLFGICHAMTPVYFLYAALIGCYLSSSLHWTATPNLIIPISIHALYDLTAFAVIRKEYFQWKSKQADAERPIDAGADPSLQSTATEHP